MKDRVTGLHGGVLGPPCSCTCSSELSGTFPNYLHYRVVR
nr:MAG TPA: Protein of unknown function (DUF1068) [Caudoviricetes sp.]